MDNLRDDNALKQFGEHLRTIRKSKGVSQENLAYTLNCPPSTIGRIERGENNVKLSTLIQISSALEIPLPELVSFNNK